MVHINDWPLECRSRICTGRVATVRADIYIYIIYIIYIYIYISIYLYIYIYVYVYIMISNSVRLPTNTVSWIKLYQNHFRILFVGRMTRPNQLNPAKYYRIITSIFNPSHNFQVGSRFVWLITGIICLIGGIISKFGALLALVPEPVIGGVLIAFFAMIFSSAITMLQRVDMTSSRNQIVLGLAFVLGVAFPIFMEKDSGDVKTGNLLCKIEFVIFIMTDSFYVTYIYKNIGRQTAHGIVSWPNPKQWLMGHTSDLMKIIRYSTRILTMVKSLMAKLNTRYTHMIRISWIHDTLW